LTVEARFRSVALGTPHGLLASGFGSGLAPIAPGTVGSVAALAPGLLLLKLPLLVMVGVILVAFLVGVWACGRTGREIGIADYGGIVWDEFVGLWIALIAVPWHWAWILAAFVAFRLFDILKPPPVRQLDRHLGGGLGVMLDDVAAGLYALLVILAARYLLGAA